MNIIIEYSTDLRVTFLAEAFKDGGHNIKFWDANRKPFFDMAYEISPDLIIVNPSIFKEEYRGNYKIISLEGLIPIGCYNPKLVYEEWGRDKTYSSDVLYISMQEPPQDFIECLNKLNQKWKVRCVGNFPLPMLNYIGTVNTEELAKFISNAEYIYDFNYTFLGEVIKSEGNFITNKDNDFGIPVITSPDHLPIDTDICLSTLDNIDMKINNYTTYKDLAEDIINGTAGNNF